MTTTRDYLADALHARLESVAHLASNYQQEITDALRANGMADVAQELTDALQAWADACNIFLGSIGKEQKKTGRHGYPILAERSTRRGDGTIILCVRPDVPSGHEPFVTWFQRMDGETFAGHYHHNIDAAVRDFQGRV